MQVVVSDPDTGVALGPINWEMGPPDHRISPT